MQQFKKKLTKQTQAVCLEPFCRGPQMKDYLRGGGELRSFAWAGRLRRERKKEAWECFLSGKVGKHPEPAQQQVGAPCKGAVLKASPNTASGLRALLSASFSKLPVKVEKYDGPTVYQKDESVVLTSSSAVSLYLAPADLRGGSCAYSQVRCTFNSFFFLSADGGPTGYNY